MAASCSSSSSSASSAGGDGDGGARGAAEAAAGAIVVAVAVRGDGRASRRAARWAAANLAPGAGRVALVHVMPPVSFVPSPSGERVPVEKMDAVTVEMYAQDRRARAQEEVFLPLRRLLGRTSVETVVLEADSVPAALVRYMAESGVRNLVVGSTSINWFRRIFRLRDVPSTVLKAMPCSCNVFVVSRHRLTIKLANQARTGKSSTRVRTQSISHRSFSHIQKNWLLDKQSLHDHLDDGILKSSGDTSSDAGSHTCSSRSISTNAGKSSGSHGRSLFGSLGRKTPGRDVNKDFDANDRLKEVPYVALSAIDESQPVDEVAKLRKELQDTLTMYDKACEDLVHAKKKVDLSQDKIEVLSSECSEEAKKVQDALQREVLLKQKVADEKAKHLEAVTEVEMAKTLFTQEAYSKHKAEIVANMVTAENANFMDALLSTGKSCRRYSKREIQLATDNFSDAKKIGEGGYGNVYRCTLDHTEVAVKVIQQDSSDKIDEFLREVEILSQLHHPNLVLLLGFCPEIGCLVYEYMENGSLEDQLISNKGQQSLHWFLRIQIIFEVSCGLAFLHATKPEPIVHRDLKPGNILLNKNYVSKIGDVGLAKLISDIVPEGLTEYRDTAVAGTLYYMDPEYQLTGTIRPKSDVYALGIIILQLLSGKRPHGLIVSAEEAIKKGSISDILDKSQIDWPIAEAEILAKLALRCTALKCRDRPSLESEVLPELESILSRVTASPTLTSPNTAVPSHFICPILQEVMDDPYVAADGHTYEHMAIKAWLKKHKTSPVTKQRLPYLSIIPNHSLRVAIQQWKSQLA
ncbi:U-box domain-containing protein 34 isoform X2 [Oryza brachyantha]|uniref:U-box domain-containing protein 34 isoform X2 n=1 Tax=Oryza brachyantha TaxID=4533 RepID=UPI001ADCDFB9|nr:U-box domain-containing protein 34 isoform X2 [Oryza brachyantha]